MASRVTFADRMPRLVVITCRPVDTAAGGWVLEVDHGDDVDLWSARAYVAGALEILDAEIDGLADDE